MRQQNIGYVFLLPILLLILCVFVYPFISVFVLSFYSTKFGFGRMDFAGLKNYLTLFREPLFWTSVRNSFVWTVMSLAIQLTVPLIFALLLNQRFRGRTLVRSLMLIPWVTPTVVVAIMGRWMLEPTVGIVNRILIRLGLTPHPVNFLGSISGALPTLVFLNSWQFIPFGTLLILAALQTIPRELAEAARVDGAGSWRVFLHLTFPLLSPMIGFVAFLAFVWNFNSFGLIWLTTEGGPMNATMTVPVLIYRKAFRTFNMGEAAALSSMSGLVLATLGVLYFKFMWKRGIE